MDNKRKRFDNYDDQPASKKVSVDVTADLNNKWSTSSVAIGSSVARSTKRAEYRPLLLDAQGRAIDEHGNLIKEESQVKVLAANVAAASANKKKENPYLAHRSSALNSQSAADAQSEPVFDDRLKLPKRELKGKKGLHFIDAGTFVKEATILQQKEERKLIAGYSSGRKNLEHKSSAGVESSLSAYEDHDTPTISTPANGPLVAPPVDTVIPIMEWWDEAFLPKELRDKRKISKAAAENDDFPLLSLTNNKTYKYIQHPVPVRPLGSSSSGKEKPIALPMFLTKKELKKLRKATRREREQEKRDKQMMGLLPPPEPKFNLGNFMKVLGDQAVADPSKVELKVLQQMQQRVLNHEMRNQAAKLTPKQRKEKKVRKLLEDTSKGVHVAVFRVLDLSHRKFQFKVDVNAQQHFLSGIVLLCEEPGKNLVVVEGGPKGIRKFVKLMTLRIPWANADSLEDPHQASSNCGAVDGGEGGAEREKEGGEGEEEEQRGEGDEESDDSDEESEGEGQLAHHQQAGLQGRGAGKGGEEGGDSSSSNRCDLLWQGMLPKRVFTGFKFHESKSAYAARKMLETKNVGHYWDMLEKADQSLASSQLLEF